MVGSDNYDYYYNDQWQVLEIRKNGDTDPWKQYAYHPDYVDAIAVRFYDENTDGAGIVAHYYLQDANFNVTAVADDAGAVVERYTYTPYGEVTFLASNFSPLTSTAIANEYLYTGRRRDPETGLQLNRNRFYTAGLGRWLNRDPIGYYGGFNLYGYVNTRPTYYVDPLGLENSPISPPIDGGVGAWPPTTPGKPLPWPPAPSPGNPNEGPQWDVIPDPCPDPRCTPEAIAACKQGCSDRQDTAVVACLPLFIFGPEVGGACEAAASVAGALCRKICTLGCP